jgi:surfactin synthase thioesterase subunit
MAGGRGMSTKYVGPNARASDSARVSGEGRIAKTRDHIVLGPSIGVSQRYITAHRDAKIGIRVNAGCFSGTVAEFREAVAKTHAKNYAQRSQYEMLADLIDAHFALADLLDAEESA